jgi:hypothetical protein
MKQSQIFVREHAINCDRLAIQQVIDLKEKTQKEVMKALHRHNLGYDQSRIESLHASLPQP